MILYTQHMVIIKREGKLSLLDSLWRMRSLLRGVVGVDGGTIDKCSYCC